MSQNDVSAMLTRLIMSNEDQRAVTNSVVAELQKDRVAINALTATQGQLAVAVSGLTSEIRQEREDRKSAIETLKAEDAKLTQRIQRISREQVWSLFWRAALPSMVALLTVMGAFFQTFPDVWARWAALLAGS